jgi:hypothetical protein
MEERPNDETVLAPTAGLLDHGYALLDPTCHAQQRELLGNMRQWSPMLGRAEEHGTTHLRGARAGRAGSNNLEIAECRVPLLGLVTAEADRQDRHDPVLVAICARLMSIVILIVDSASTGNLVVMCP